MPKSFVLNEQPESPFSEQDMARIEDAYRRLSIPKGLIARCERCGIPCDQAKRDCDALEQFFAKLIAEFSSVQAPTNTNLQGTQ